MCTMAGRSLGPCGGRASISDGDEDRVEPLAQEQGEEYGKGEGEGEGGGVGWKMRGGGGGSEV